MSDEICYICYAGEGGGDGGEEGQKEFARVPPPCKCTGSILIHKECLEEQIDRDIYTCTICQEPFHEDYIQNNITKLYNRWGYMVKETTIFTWPDDRSFGELQKLYYDADENGFMEVYTLDGEFLTDYYTIVAGKKEGIGYKYFHIEGEPKVEYIYTYAQGRKHGKYWKYLRNGRLINVGWYENGQKQGLVRTYTESHPTEPFYCMYSSIGYYHTSEKEGLFLYYGDFHWDEERNQEYRIECIPYNLGAKHGTRYEYSIEGELRSLLNYKFDLKHGSEYKWYRNGRVKQICHYVRDSYCGLFRKYYPNGQLERLDCMSPSPESDEDDDNYIYTMDIQLLSHEWYQNGQMRHVYEPSRSLHWYPDGQFERIQTRKEGLYRMWHKGGQLWSMHYSDGRILRSDDPLVQGWNKDGTLISREGIRLTQRFRFDPENSLSEGDYDDDDYHVE
jgi:antitoxin component YwqK of YwqJK toxin-antitoxin module